MAFDARSVRTIARRTVDLSPWLPHLADDCCLRIGARRTVFGRLAVEADLAAFLRGVRHFGECFCEVFELPDLLLADTDLLPLEPVSARPLPCVITARTARGIIMDLRFHFDTSCLPT